MQAQEIRNGVNVDQWFEAINAIRESPSLAKARFRAKNKWINGGHNESTIKDFYAVGQEDTSRKQPFIVDADEPAVLLGEDHGPNPVEYVLHALAACLTTTLIYYAAANGVEIEEVESSYEGELDARGVLGLSKAVRKGYDNIGVTFRVKGAASDEELEELIRLAQDRSPVFDILTNPVPVSVHLEKGQVPEKPDAGRRLSHLNVATERKG